MAGNTSRKRPLNSKTCKATPGTSASPEPTLADPPHSDTAPDEPLAVDYCRSGAVVMHRSDGSRQRVHKATCSRGMGALGSLARAFLPEGYPDSVSPDYLRFQVWDTIQALSSYVRGLLTSQALLRGVGVGQQAATPLAAVFTFFARDLAGHLGGILFAVSQGSSFDSCAKQWRLFADGTNNIGMAVELASPFFPGAFMAMACFGSVARAMTGVAGGATRAALTQHFAQQGNAADVAAREASQETATTLMGMVAGMAFTHATADHAPAAWALFVLLTLLHMWANIQAVRSLVIPTLNAPRLVTVLEAYMKTGAVPGPSQVALTEDLTTPPLLPLVSWVRHGGRPRHTSITLGVTLEQLAQRGHLDQQQVVKLVRAAAAGGQPYIVHADGSQAWVAVHREFTTGPDLLRAYVHALQLGRQRFAPLPPGPGGRGCAAADTQQWMSNSYGDLLTKCRNAGWEADRPLLKLSGNFTSFELRG